MILDFFAAIGMVVVACWLLFMAIVAVDCYQHRRTHRHLWRQIERWDAEMERDA